MKTPSLYVALGDSITSGYGVGKNGFAHRYYAVLVSRDPSCRFVNFGKNGQTIASLAQRLATDPKIQALVAQATIITLTIGSNDLLHRIRALRGNLPPSMDLGPLLENLQAIGELIRSLNRDASVKITTIYNPLPASLLYLYAKQAQKIINQANELIYQLAKRFSFQVISVDKAFHGKEPLVLARDYVHPNTLGYQVIALEFAKN